MYLLFITWHVFPKYLKCKYCSFYYILPSFFKSYWEEDRINRNVNFNVYFIRTFVLREKIFIGHLLESFAHHSYHEIDWCVKWACRVTLLVLQELGPQIPKREPKPAIVNYILPSRVKVAMRFLRVWLIHC